MKRLADISVTIVLVTHDIDEAVYLADRVLVLSRAPGPDRRLDRRPPIARPRSQPAIRSSARFLAVRDELHALISPDKWTRYTQIQHKSAANEPPSSTKTRTEIAHSSRVGLARLLLAVTAGMAIAEVGGTATARPRSCGPSTSPSCPWSPPRRSMYAKDRGFFRKQGIDVKIKVLTDPTQTAAAVLSGKAQFSAAQRRRRSRA